MLKYVQEKEERGVGDASSLPIREGAGFVRSRRYKLIYVVSRRYMQSNGSKLGNQ